MSVPYGYKPYYGPTGKVDFAWIGESWNIFKQSWWIWVLSALIYIAVMFAIILPLEFAMMGNIRNITPAAVNSNPFALYQGISWYWMGAFYLGSMLISLYMTSSYLHLGLKAVRREPIAFSDAFAGFPVMGRLFVLTLIIGAIVIVPSMIIPFALASGHAVIAGVCYLILALVYLCIYPLLLVAPAMVADGVSPIVAIKQSVAVMKNSFFIALLFIIATSTILTLIAVLTCDLGFLVVLPMGYIMMILAYRDMVGMDGIQEPQFPYQQAFAPGPPQPQPGTWPPPPGQQQSYGQSDPQQYQQPPYQQPPPPQQPYQPPQQPPDSTGQ